MSDISILGSKKRFWGPEKSFFCVSLDHTWGFYSALKSILQNEKAVSMIVEVDLTKVGCIYNLSTEEGGMRFSLETQTLVECWTSSEVYISSIPQNTLTGQAWLVSPTSFAGRDIMKVAGYDRIRNADGGIKIFGRYSLWREAFLAFLGNKTNSFLSELQCYRK